MCFNILNRLYLKFLRKYAVNALNILAICMDNSNIQNMDGFNNIKTNLMLYTFKDSDPNRKIHLGF